MPRVFGLGFDSLYSTLIDLIEEEEKEKVYRKKVIKLHFHSIPKRWMWSVREDVFELVGDHKKRRHLFYACLSMALCRGTRKPGIERVSLVEWAKAEKQRAEKRPEKNNPLMLVHIHSSALGFQSSSKQCNHNVFLTK